MRGWDIRRLSVVLVLGAEAAGAVLLHEHFDEEFVAIGIVVLVAFAAWVLESGIHRSVRKWNWAAEAFGVRLREGPQVHGWWYGLIRADPTGDETEGPVIGGSVFRIRASVDNFTMFGEAWMLTRQRWARWDGRGTASGDDEIVYRYKGVEDGNTDEGYGYYRFAGSTPPTFTGAFYGSYLNQHNHRRLEGKRCARKAAKGFDKDPEKVRKGLAQYLKAELGPLAPLPPEYAESGDLETEPPSEPVTN